MPAVRPFDLTPTLVGFARALRAAGVAATTDRVEHLCAALAALDPNRRADVYWAGRLTLCGSADDLDRYDRVFAAYFAGDVPRTAERPVSRTVILPSVGGVEGHEPGEGEEETAALRANASRAEVLRHRDFAALDPAERAALARLLAAFRLPGEHRRTRRWRPARRGSIDREHTVRRLLRSGGEPARLARRRHRRRPRRVVLLVDVSGSMTPYATALLRFAHAAAQGRPARSARTEVLTMGTRLTRVTREMSHRDPDQAMAALSAAVPDWSGGTRLGEQLKAFLDRWGQRGMARGAVVVVLSDGWEQGDVALLAEQMARLARLAHRVVWANPRKGRAGYAPLVAGMAAALPYVDDFMEGHSLGALERLARVVAGAARRTAHA